MFAEFESLTHSKAESGEALTPDVLCKLYKDVYQKYWGPEMKIDEEDDTFSSLFFTKANIDVKRSGNPVVLQLKNEGIMGFDFKTGKKLFKMDI